MSFFYFGGGGAGGKKPFFFLPSPEGAERTLQVENNWLSITVSFL